jgi:glycine cleavage system H protein
MKKPEMGMSIPDELLYTENHEWIRMIDDITCICGMTDYGQNNLGEIVSVEFVKNIVDTKLEIMDTVLIVDSVKTTADLLAPVSGIIVTINREAEDSPELINNDPYGDGWLFKIEIKDRTELDNLMSPDEYMEMITVDVI